VFGICSTADLESECGLMLRDKEVKTFANFSVLMHACCCNYISIFANDVNDICMLPLMHLHVTTDASAAVFNIITSQDCWFEPAESISGG